MNQPLIDRFRDLSIVHLLDRKLVFACDSCSGIGMKPMDKVRVAPYIVGRFLARTALMEVISVGGSPLVLFNTLNVEMHPMGTEIIQGVEAEAFEGGIRREGINGSTEDNMRTVQTGAGIVVMGEASNLHMKSKANEVMVCVGIPKVGHEVQLDDHEICDLPTILILRSLPGVSEIVPVGSKGINYEIQALLHRNRLSMKKIDCSLPLDKSAGPSTCVVVTLATEQLALVRQKLKQPVHVLGVLK